MTLTVDAELIKSVVALQLKNDPKCGRLRALFEAQNGEARVQILNVTHEALLDLWRDVMCRRDVITPLCDVTMFIGRGVDRIVAALKRGNAVLSASDPQELHRAVGELLVGIFRRCEQTAAEASPSHGVDSAHSELIQKLLDRRYAYMKYAVRTGKAFSDERIAAALEISLTEARRVKRWGCLKTEELAKILELPESAVDSLSTPHASPAALNQLLEHTGYRDTTQRIEDKVAELTYALAGTSQSADRISRADADGLATDHEFEALATKFRNHKGHGDE